MSDAVPIPPRTAKSPPIDPSKLNNAPAPLPIPTPDIEQEAISTSAALRSPEESLATSAYLDGAGAGDGPVEPASHPTIAETGVLAAGGNNGVGKADKSGQLKRVEGGEKKEGIVKLGSLGGEGLVRKPPVGLGEE